MKSFIELLLSDLLSYFTIKSSLKTFIVLTSIALIIIAIYSYAFYKDTE